MAFELGYVLKGISILKKVIGISEKSEGEKAAERVAEVYKEQLDKAEKTILEQAHKIEEQEKKNDELYRLLIRRGRK